MSIDDQHGDPTFLLVQADVRGGQPEANLRTLRAALEAEPAADVAVFPELFMEGYMDGVAGSGLDPAGSEVAAVRAEARRSGTALIVGLSLRAADGKSNAALCVDQRGEIAGIYRKIFLFDQEAAAFAGGDTPAVVELCGRRLGILVCFDTEFPELARALAGAGAEALVTISANMDPHFANHRLHTRARALENRIPHLYVNRCGDDEPYHFIGGTRVVDADGEVRAELPTDAAGTLVTTLPRRASTADDEALDYPAIAARIWHGATASARRPADIVQTRREESKCQCES